MDWIQVRPSPPNPLRITACALIVLLLCCCFTAPSVAMQYACNCGDVRCCPDLGQIELTLGRTFEGSYRHGEPYDVVTITPDNGFETLEELGIRLRIRIVCSCAGFPIEGIPASDMLLYSSTGCWCSSGNSAAQDTDADGWTEFTGTIRGGGCASSLFLIIDGVVIASIPLATNSPDSSHGFGCSVDQSDLAAFATVLGNPSRYSICFDYNESGSVDASDLAYFAAFLGMNCE